MCEALKELMAEELEEAEKKGMNKVKLVLNPIIENQKTTIADQKTTIVDQKTTIAD